MSENLSETDLTKTFYTSEEDAELEETTEESEDDEPVDDDEESTDDEEEAEEESETIVLDGQEISAETLKEWKLSHDNRKHQQADYTKKGQEASDIKKQATAEKDMFTGLNSSLQESIDAVELLLAEEENAINWDELTDEDPGEALKLERKFKKRRTEIESAKSKLSKANKQANDAKIQEQGNELVTLIPDWFDSNGSTSKAYKQDTDTIMEYLNANGYPANYANKITTAKEWHVLRDASKYQALQKKKPGIKKKVTSVKSVKGKSKSAPQSEADILKLFYG
jgi:hypothetical protein